VEIAVRKANPQSVEEEMLAEGKKKRSYDFLTFAIPKNANVYAKGYFAAALQLIGSLMHQI